MKVLSNQLYKYNVIKVLFAMKEGFGSH